MNYFHMYNSIALGPSPVLYNHPFPLVPKHFHLLQRKLHTHESAFSHFSFPEPLETTSLLVSIWIYLFWIDKWNHAMDGILHLDPITE